MRYVVAVDVATSRPPRVDATLMYRIQADTESQAHLTALQWAASRPGVVMPVGSRIISEGVFE